MASPAFANGSKGGLALVGPAPLVQALAALAAGSSCNSEGVALRGLLAALLVWLAAAAESPTRKT